MTGGAAGGPEQLLAAQHVSGNHTPWRRLGGAHEVGEGHDILAVIFGFIEQIIFGAKTHEATGGGVLFRKQRAGDAHFVYIGIRCKGLQTGMLALPAEAPDARRAA